jgi:hypothetical protein
MFRFSIRELMLVTLVAAVSTGWAIDHWRPNNPSRQFATRFNAMEAGLKLLGYELEDSSWGTTVYVVRNKERPWIRNSEQRPGETLVGSGISGPAPMSPNP